MRIPRLYCPELDTSQTSLVLPDDAHRHAVQVLRLKQGAVIRLFNGRGFECEATLQQVERRQSVAVLGVRIEGNNESPISVTLLQGISRGERMDYAIQKAVELGVNRIVPVVTGRCNVQLSNGRAEKRLMHWHGAIVSACEQSGRNIMPELTTVMQFEEALAGNDVSCKLVLDPMAETGFSSLSKQQNVVLLIGPEGGLSEQEISLAVNAGFEPIRFGPRILRTETAAVAALAVVQTMWGDLG